LALFEPLFVGVDGLEIAATTEQQLLLELALQRAVRGLDVAILLLLADAGRSVAHVVVVHESHVRLVECALCSFLVRSRSRVVRLMLCRHVIESMQCLLYAALYREERLTEAHRQPLPIGVHLHEVAQKMGENLARNRDTKLVRAREVRLRELPSQVLLREENLSLRATLSTPTARLTLQRTQLPILVSLGMKSAQLVEQRSGLELRRLAQTLLDPWPMLRKWILACTPVPVLDELARQLAGAHVLAGRLAIDPGLETRAPNSPALIELRHQFPHLSVGRGHGRSERSASPAVHHASSLIDGEI